MQRSGFTLIEILISLAVFMLFVGIAATSYLQITTANKRANIERQMTNEVRSVLEDLERYLRFYTVDMAYYADGSVDPSQTLALLSADGQHRILFQTVTPTEEGNDHPWTYLGIYREVKVDGVFNPEEGFTEQQFEPMHTQKVHIKALRWSLNPVGEDSHWQSRVTVALSVQPYNPLELSLRQISADWQTSFSSRVYTEL